MPNVDIEFQERAQDRLALFIKKTAKGIEQGYDAGNCTPESEAFWTLYPKTELSPGWRLLRIEIELEGLTEREIGAAVRRVGTEPEGVIEVFGKKVGYWRQSTDIPS